MKLHIVLLVLASIAICSESEKVKGRRSNIRIEQLNRNEKDNPSKGRFFHKKGNQGSQQPTIIILDKAPQEVSSPAYYDVDISGTFTTSDVDDNSTRSLNDDFLDSEDEVENEQAPRRNEKRNNNLKLKKINGKQQVYGNSASSKKGVNKLQLIRLSGNNNKYPDNLAVRRLVIPQ